MISRADGKLIVIDNADILLNDDTRKYISLDGKDQYLIIGRNPKNLFATKENLFVLVSKKIGEQTDHRTGPKRTGVCSVWCSPIIFSIQIILYQRPNLYPHLWNSPTFTNPRCAWKSALFVVR